MGRMRNDITYVNDMPSGYRYYRESVIIRQFVATCNKPFANMYSRFAGMTITVNAAPALMVNNKVVVGRCNKFLQLRLSGSGSFTKLLFIIFHFLNNGNKNADQPTLNFLDHSAVKHNSRRKVHGQFDRKRSDISIVIGGMVKFKENVWNMKLSRLCVEMSRDPEQPKLDALGSKRTEKGSP